MKAAIIALIVGAIIPGANGGELRGSSTFGSVQEFVSAVGAFKPAAVNGDFSALFTVPDLGQPDDPETGKLIAAPAITSCDVLWQGNTSALVFAHAMPPLVATRCEVGVLFLLEYSHDRWDIADHRRFVATGKDAGVRAEQTAGSDLPLGDGAVITVTESEGGRGYEYLTSASYTISASRLEVMKLR